MEEVGVMAVQLGTVQERGGDLCRGALGERGNRGEMKEQDREWAPAG